MPAWRDILADLRARWQRATEEAEGCGRCAVCHHVCDLLKNTNKPQAKPPHGSRTEEE